MDVLRHSSALLGINLASINTKAAFFGRPAGKYQALACEGSQTSIGHGLHLGFGIVQALKALQARVDQPFLKDSGGLIMPVDRFGQGVDHVAMVTSAGVRVPTVLIGLSELGSIKAAKALLSGLPIRLENSWGISHLIDDARTVEELIKIHPKIIVIVGGEDAGTSASIVRWIEIVRTTCKLLPATIKPMIVYAGSYELATTVQRRLEPVTKVSIASNIQPDYRKYDLIPAGNALERAIIDIWKLEINGFPGLYDLTKGLTGLTSRCLERMVRFLSQPRGSADLDKMRPGKLAVDLGGAYTTLSAGVTGSCGTVIQDKFPLLGGRDFDLASRSIYEWIGLEVPEEEVTQFLANYALVPTWAPETRREMVLWQAFSRYRLEKAVKELTENFPWFRCHQEIGLGAQFDPIFVSGSEIIHSPNPGWTLLTLLDGIQPLGITTFIIDRWNLFPILGKIGEIEPILAVQVLASNTFQVLGTAITAVGSLAEGKIALTVHIKTEFGKAYSVDIYHGELKRLLIPAEGEAEIELVPHPNVDIGFGERGKGGKMTVTGGGLGVVIDARGRPLKLPREKDRRIETLQRWMGTMGVDLV